MSISTSIAIGDNERSIPPNTFQLTTEKILITIKLW